MFKILHFFKTTFMFTVYYPIISIFDYTIQKKKKVKIKIYSNILNF